MPKSEPPVAVPCGKLFPFCVKSFVDFFVKNKLKNILIAVFLVLNVVICAIAIVFYTVHTSHIVDTSNVPAYVNKETLKYR